MQWMASAYLRSPFIPTRRRFSFTEDFNLERVRYHNCSSAAASSPSLWGKAVIVLHLWIIFVLQKNLRGVEENTREMKRVEALCVFVREAAYRYTATSFPNRRVRWMGASDGLTSSLY